MTKLSIIFFLGVTACMVERICSMGVYYYADNQGAMSYQYPPYSPYVFAPYAVPSPPDCDKKKEEGSSESSSSSSESSSSESSSEEGSKEGEGGSSESSSEAEGEGGSKEEGEESSSSSSSSSEEGGSKEEGEGKKEEKEGKKPKAVFPPISYPFPPRPAQQVIYSAPVQYSYLPLKTYSAVQQPVSYPISSSYPYYSISSYPMSAGYSSPVVKSYAAPPVGRIITTSIGKVASAYTVPSVAKTIAYNPLSSNVIAAPSSYWNSGANLGYYKA